MKKSWKIDRRHFLRGCGAAMALPALDVMGASEPGATPPTRYLTVFQPNGVYPKAWDVQGIGKNYAFSPILKPLEPLREHFTVLSGIDNVASGNHVAMTTAFLTGCGATNEQEFMSLDQMIADKIGGDTLLPSLELGTEPPRQGAASGLPISYANTISWRSSSARLSPEINPQVAFDRMFRHRTDPHARREAQDRKSILDVVLEDAKALQRRASKQDQQKLDEYFTSVRAVELRLDKTLEPPERRWKSPMEPEYVRPAAGIPRNRDEHLKLMIDLMVLAFWTDTTRVGTLMTAHGFSRQNFSFLEGVTSDHHGMSHHKEQPKAVAEYTTVSNWYAGQVAYLLERMKNIDDGHGSMLDNSVVFYGSSMKDGNGHRKENLPLLLAGGGGGKLSPGRHLQMTTNTPLPNLHLTLLHLFGIEAKDFNHRSTGMVSGLI